MKPPIIIGGCPRSGTTLLLAILSAHPNIYTIKEETGAFAGRDDVKIGKFLPRKLKLRWCEKTPDNVLCFKTTLKRFKGKVKLIHIVRDGRDVITSIHPQDTSKFFVEPHTWVSSVSAGLIPEALIIRYEDLVQDFETTISRVLDFIEEEMALEIVLWVVHTKIKLSPAWFKEVSEVHDASISRWKQPQYVDRVKQLMNIPDAVNLLKRFGYL